MNTYITIVRVAVSQKVIVTRAVTMEKAVTMMHSHCRNTFGENKYIVVTGPVRMGR